MRPQYLPVLLMTLFSYRLRMCAHWCVAPPRPICARGVLL